ncbi:hypothetical protein J4E85_008824 [Alternaria conjuncta]|uniref:uncharacterized protein n=1 Tax=Alternaria conjuncta TaxID=181017 RepID=UPI00221EB4C0|nr:uncharacterized protein J4E85_008824 [Alternaria conjuncta]KAI4921479.1 hypothetical protein J4E85_008824 [Alternaria conjuncta]
MRVSITPVFLFASLASAAPQWSDHYKRQWTDHYKREAPTPSPELVQRQESFAVPEWDKRQWTDHYKREVPTPSPELVQRQESFVPPPPFAAVRRQDSAVWYAPGGKREAPTPAPELVQRQESFVPPRVARATPIAEAAVRRQDSILRPPKREVPPTPAPQALGKRQNAPRQHTDPPETLQLRGMPRRDDAEAPEPTEPPSPRDLPVGDEFLPRSDGEEEPITNARRAADPEPTGPSDQPQVIVPRQKTEDGQRKRNEKEPITELRRDAYANPEPTDPPSPCDKAEPAKVKPRTEEEEPTDPPKARDDTDTNPILKALSGTYSLVNTSSSRNGEPIPDLPYGKAPVGLLIYTESGFMSATITATEPEFRPNLTFPYQPNDSDADWALVGKHSIGYAGPYSVNEELPATETEGQIFHGPLTVANVPTWEGQKGKRNYTIVEVEENGEEVTYLKIGSERGNGYRGILWWKKVD